MTIQTELQTKAAELDTAAAASASRACARIVGAEAEAEAAELSAGSRNDPAHQGCNNKGPHPLEIDQLKPKYADHCGKRMLLCCLL